MKKIMRHVDKIPVTCPLCHSPIQKIIREDNCLPIDENGIIIDLINTTYEEYLECSKCHVKLDDVIKTIGEHYTLYSRGIERTKRLKKLEHLSLNPFGKMI